MPLWSKGKDGRCRAVGQIGLCLRRCGATRAGCRPVYYTGLQHVEIYPINDYFLVEGVVEERKSVFVRACNKIKIR